MEIRELLNKYFGDTNIEIVSPYAYEGDTLNRNIFTGSKVEILNLTQSLKDHLLDKTINYFTVRCNVLVILTH